ncbi:hypothetical protein HHK36_004724 [Tetracentron sinense]|uniref:non-specific serine/threonine protein kinase n=1 Tax=Tetracentron sinense TaxID=13715 RepID=A0A835DM48_TETSI|nr:hypothetical protein HHK36_004724 [Tetracentron sinense]
MLEDSEFAVKCGGTEITSSNNIVFEMDNATLGPASYFVTDTNRWAVSNVGRFGESNNAEYTRFSSSQFTNTLDSELFQSARLSPGSLRYYGLGLENGNYTVSLQFAETAFQDSRTWESVGRRVFDIYLQGNLEVTDFDIRKEAGGAILRAVDKVFKARVSENYLEIHLFWAGKGTCCIPAQGTYGPSISAISVTPDFVPTVSNTPPTNKKKKTGVIVGIAVAVGVVSFLSVFVVFFLMKRRKRQQSNVDEELLGIDARPYTFSYAELRTATEDFNPSNKLGEGGFGPVFKGTLSDGRVIAVKQLSVASHQGKSQFVAEIATISACSSTLRYDRASLNPWHLQAWHLHENNRELELVDATLSQFSEEEAKRIIGIGLLCTQASPMLRPPMSRVVAMLSRDIEVSAVTTKPGYLTDWKFNDVTGFMTDDTTGTSTSRTDNSQYSSSSNTKAGIGADLSPENTKRPMLHEIVGEGR